METGTGIFLGAIFLGLLWLVATKGKSIRWGRLVLWIVALIVLLGCGIALYNYLENRPKLTTGWWELKIGESREDVIFKKGQPNSSKARDGKETLVYNDDRSSYVIGLSKQGTVDFVVIDQCDYKDRDIPGPYLQGIGSFATSERIIEKFGPPQKDSFNKTGTGRIFNYPQYGVTFNLIQDKVCMMGAINPATKGLVFNN
jgi:hypothetical protein